MNVLVMASGHASTLADCLDGLATQDYPRPVVVTVVDSAPSDGAGALALSHPAVHWVILTSKVGEPAILQHAAPYSQGAHLAVINAACRPDPCWLTDGVAQLEGGADVVVETAGEDGVDSLFPSVFLARRVVSRIRFDDAGTPQCREPEGFYLRCRAAGFQVTNDPDTKVRSARTSSSPRPPLSYTTAGLVDASIRLPPSHSGPACTDLISVVVCTKGERTAHLERCLDSIGRLDDPNFEVILVHNASSPAPPRGRLEAHGAKLIHERQRGLDNARNSGVRESTGGIVAFVDDDCDVDPDWLKGFRRALSDPLVAFATGRVRPARLEDPCEQWFECHFSFDRGPFPQRFTTFDSWPWSPLLMGMLGTGANMAFRREILERIGDFDPALDMGTLVGGGGDLDIFARALADGKVCQYAPDAVVFHHHRDNMTKLRWQTWGYGICQGALCAKYVFRQPGYRLHALVQFIRLLRDHHRRAVASKSGSDRYPSALVNLELAGIVLGPFAYAASALFQRRSRR